MDVSLTVFFALILSLASDTCILEVPLLVKQGITLDCTEGHLWHGVFVNF